MSLTSAALDFPGAPAGLSAAGWFGGSPLAVALDGIRVAHLGRIGRAKVQAD